jgi:hypothetical protein
MGVKLSKNKVVPATAEKVFDEMWLTHFNVSASNPNAPIRLMAIVDKARILQDGTIELAGEPEHIMMEDFFAEAEKDASLLALMGEILNKVKSHGKL